MDKSDKEKIMNSINAVVIALSNLKSNIVDAGTTAFIDNDRESILKLTNLMDIAEGIKTEVENTMPLIAKFNEELIGVVHTDKLEHKNLKTTNIAKGDRKRLKIVQKNELKNQ